MKALEFSRKPAKYAAAMVAGRIRPGAGAQVGPIRLRDLDEPERPSDEWVELRPLLAGICGSDLSTIDGHSSRYFEPIVSFPFVPGHEVVGHLDDASRAVLIPVLHCRIRGIEPVCAACGAGQINRCERIAFGHLEPGLQSGFCCDTGGGWSESMLAHPDQLVTVPDELSDEAAVMVEPTACAVHAAAQVTGDGPVAVIGAGTLGLLTVAALDRTDLIVAAKHPHQQKLAKELGAHRVVEPSELAGAVRLATSSMKLGRQLTGGAPTVVDCVGSEASLAQALEVVAPGGTVLVVGMPATTTLDLTGLWHREVALRGVYAYDGADFATAMELVATKDLGRLVTQTYPLRRYTDALAHAAEAGRRGAVKIAFDPRDQKERSR
ncbi:MAG: zinc-binding dehydrogenase [Acidimicrobiales bacterium]|nr:zinc-binding dehydrogenase [Acidimicrobiales bacterium]